MVEKQDNSESETESSSWLAAQAGLGRLHFNKVRSAAEAQAPAETALS